MRSLRIYQHVFKLSELNIVAVRASYILPILRRFLSENPRKPGGVVYLPPEITQTETTLQF